MKFGKLLQLRALPEWREHYLSYKKLKRFLKMLPRSDEQTSPSESPTKTPSPQRDDRQHRIVTSPSDSELGDALLSHSAATRSQVLDSFSALIDSDLTRINAHVSLQRTAIKKCLSLLMQQNTASVVLASPASRLDTKRALDQALLRSTYCDCIKLRAFVQLNHEGMRKIVKKLDKYAGGPTRQAAMLERLSSEPFYAGMRDFDEWSAELERMCGHPELIRRMRADAKASCASQAVATTPRYGALILAASLATLTSLLTPLLDGDNCHVHERRCACVLVAVLVLWLTEALPYFVTAMLVPPLVVIGKVLPEPHMHKQVSLAQGQRLGLSPLASSLSVEAAVPRPDLPAEAAAKLLLNELLGSETILLVLSGLIAAAVVSRCQLELRFAVTLQRWLRHYPLLFLLTVMQLSLLLSMCISNITAPILLLSVVQPMLRELPTGSRYAKAITLGLAFSCNLGGMLTPIASPQNAVALHALHDVGSTISFGSWLATAVPIAELGVFIVHALLLLLLRPFDCEELPLIFVENTGKMTLMHGLMLTTVMATTLLWASLSFAPLHDTFGDPAIVGLTMTALAFGSGFLTKEDFNGLAWHLLALLGGGNCLGLAVSKSGLLALAANALLASIGTSSVWALTAELVTALLVITSFVSHTVAAIVTMPLIASIGMAAGEPARIVFCCALTCSAAMALPMSSFPNVNSLLAEDDYGRPFLATSDFVKVGLPVSIMVSFLAATAAFWMIGLIHPE